jgi:hypothetical protein
MPGGVGSMEDLRGLTVMSVAHLDDGGVTRVVHS